MEIQAGDTQKHKYELYAEHCLKMAKIVSDREARLLLREMAAELLKLVEPDTTATATKRVGRKSTS